MKYNDDKNNVLKAIFFMWLFMFLYGLFALTSCKTAEDHLQKFYKKGGKIECNVDTIKVIDTLLIDGDTVYKVRDSIVIRTETNIQTRYQVKFDHKRFKDSLSHEKSVYKLDLRALKDRNKYLIDSLNKVRQIEGKRYETELKKAKAEKKSSVFWTWIGKRWWLFLIIGFAIRQFLPLIIKLLKHKI